MNTHELAVFIDSWSNEAQRTLRIMRALPADKYDFRPDPDGRSLGELAWHLAEVDALVAEAVSTGVVDFNAKVPGLERPRTVTELAPGYERLHAACMAKVKALGPAQLERKLPSPMGGDVAVSTVLWDWLLFHAIHHRGQLSLMCRLAGKMPPGLYGPTREEMAAMRARA